MNLEHFGLARLDSRLSVDTKAERHGGHPRAGLAVAVQARERLRFGFGARGSVPLALRETTEGNQSDNGEDNTQPDAPDDRDHDSGDDQNASQAKAGGTCSCVCHFSLLCLGDVLAAREPAPTLRLRRDVVELVVVVEG